MNVLIVGFPLKILVGILMIMASIPLLATVLGAQLQALPVDLYGLAVALAGGR